MEIFLIKLLQFILAISLLILLHEGGHFFFSKLFGVRVEKFYLFFDPWFHLFQSSGEIESAHEFEFAEAEDLILQRRCIWELVDGKPLF